MRGTHEALLGAKEAIEFSQRHSGRPVGSKQRQESIEIMLDAETILVKRVLTICCPHALT